MIDRYWPLERRALDVLHHQIVGTDIVELADVGMIERGDGLGLTLESFVELDFEVLIATMRSRRVSSAL